MTPEQFEHFMQQQQAEQNLQQSQPQEQYNPEMDHADLDARFEAFRLEQDIEKQLAASQKKEGYGEEYDSFLRQQVGLTLQSDEYNGDPFRYCSGSSRENSAGRFWFSERYCR